MQEYKNNLKLEAEELVVDGFPTKIVQLNSLLQSKEFADKNFNFEYDVVSTNSQVSHKVEVVKPLIRQLLHDVHLLKMWINLILPKIADGNNFGVEIQLETLKEITIVESQAASYFNQISYYFKVRADLVSSVNYKPDIEDYRRAVKETDENEFFNMNLMLGEIRDHYTSLHDMISKNMEKLKKPRPSPAIHLY